MDNLYAEYAITKARIKTLTKEAENIALKILEDLQEKGETTKETNVGKFTVCKRKNWIYPKSVVELSETLKEEKAKAESTGEATYEEKDSLLFTPVNL
jgi:hypothetical protein